MIKGRKTNEEAIARGKKKTMAIGMSIELVLNVRPSQNTTGYWLAQSLLGELIYKHLAGNHSVSALLQARIMLR
jgi:hypothetical protein